MRGAKNLISAQVNRFAATAGATLATREQEPSRDRESRRTAGAQVGPMQPRRGDTRSFRPQAGRVARRRRLRL